jgi:hypothetical protein
VRRDLEAILVEHRLMREALERIAALPDEGGATEARRLASAILEELVPTDEPGRRRST